MSMIIRGKTGVSKRKAVALSKRLNQEVRLRNLLLENSPSEKIAKSIISLGSDEWAARGLEKLISLPRRNNPLKIAWIEAFSARKIYEEIFSDLEKK